MIGLVHCARYRCDLEEKTCARRYALAQESASRPHIRLCRDCPEGAERAAGLTITVPKNARYLPVFGRGERR
jgi:hypothetical protein